MQQSTRCITLLDRYRVICPRLRYLILSDWNGEIININERQVAIIYHILRRIGIISDIISIIMCYVHNNQFFDIGEYLVNSIYKCCYSTNYPIKTLLLLCDPIISYRILLEEVKHFYSVVRCMYVKPRIIRSFMQQVTYVIDMHGNDDISNRNIIRKIKEIYHRCIFMSAIRSAKQYVSIHDISA